MQLLRPTTATIRYVTGCSKAVVSLRTSTPPSSHHCRTFVTCPKVERSLFYLGAKTPSDLVRIGQEAVAASSDIIADVGDRPQDGDVEGRDLIYTIDHISNTLCLVADPCELLRHVHPDDEWRAAANATVEEVSAFISRVNIDEKASVYI
ncbi:Mitochondrial intermediate peptidase 1 [Babesia bigemina]|uniref:Mitochondrial intermediate peptidase 1 n=1 Tax=Babesia bigemina TaxID=5866 RepID=A0A061D965_BABBI|nr:Mitochondrial intermediate peptidase 1 [Babesia bigemina]CDR96522.1 Mitochondrial intermediate peptidase 1 [Babesia bigemina]|eukprot:XP_012768708.1 Mitochondrial intermediate peptidase 1 [Babesia bigemina]